MTKIFLLFDEKVFYQPIDEFLVVVSKIFLGRSQMTKIKKLKKMSQALPNAEKRRER